MENVLQYTHAHAHLFIFLVSWCWGLEADVFALHAAATLVVESLGFATPVFTGDVLGL